MKAVNELQELNIQKGIEQMNQVGSITIIVWDDGDVTYHAMDDKLLMELVSRLDNIQAVYSLLPRAIGYHVYFNAHEAVDYMKMKRFTGRVSDDEKREAGDNARTH